MPHISSQAYRDHIVLEKSRKHCVWDERGVFAGAGGKMIHCTSANENMSKITYTND
jgi:hypothetical protein